MSTLRNTLNIISIDVGLKTFSLCREAFNLDDVKLNCPGQKYAEYGAATKEFEEFVIHVGSCGKLTHLEKTDLGEKKDIFTGVAFLNLYNWLDSLNENEVFNDIDFVLVEAQMKTNHIATALMHHLHAWFLMKFRGKVIVKLYPSKNKTRVLGMPLKMVNRNNKLTKATKYQRKKWSVEMCKRVLEARNDVDNIKHIWVDNKAKKDDLCDTVMQCLSYVVNHVISSKITKRVRKSDGEEEAKKESKSKKKSKTKKETKVKRVKKTKEKEQNKLAQLLNVETNETDEKGEKEEKREEKKSKSKPRKKE